MKVYSVLRHVQYEGSDLLGVFGTREDAIEFIKYQEGIKEQQSDYFGFIESELGQPVDLFEDVTWWSLYE